MRGNPGQIGNNFVGMVVKKGNKLISVEEYLNNEADSNN